MKILLFLLLNSFTLLATAGELKLAPFDQEILLGLVGRLPVTVRSVLIEDIQTPTSGQIITSQFPQEESPFIISCEGHYFNGSIHASYSQCSITIDDHHPLTQTKHDEYQIEITEPTLVNALFETISFGRPAKEFRSFGKDRGVSFTGKNTNIFHYYFKCDLQKCIMRFSKKIEE